MTRILVCGDRNWRDSSAIARELLTYPAGSVVIHGDCRGADRMAGVWAEQYGFSVERFPAEWQKYGNAAGPIRNQRMLDEGKPDVVLAFHSDIAKSKGTADMVRRARRVAGLVVRVIER